MPWDDDFSNLISILLLIGTTKLITRNTFPLNMSHINKTKLLDTAVEAALASSNLIMEAYDNPKIINHKGRTNLVTETDKKSERLIKSIIKSSYPSHSFLAEESGKDMIISDFLWIIDPLDGTTNFVTVILVLLSLLVYCIKINHWFQ